MEKTQKKIKKPWPIKEAMQQVYSEHLWGGDEFDFYSGEGSHAIGLIEPYVEAVVSFLTNFEEPISVCDLGCGDFNVGMKLVEYTQKYVAIDIVPELIERNKKIFKVGNLEFRCLDIAKDKLPVADCAIVKQVLQHLSNNEVQQVVEKLKYYKYVLLTEHIPGGKFEPNIDIISGQGTRLKKHSGLNLLASPFNLKVKEEKQLLCIRLEEGKGVIETRLFTIF